MAGIVGLANDLEVLLPGVDDRPDPDITRDAVAAIKSQLPFASEQIKVTVKNGWVMLEGEVECLSTARNSHFRSPSTRMHVSSTRQEPLVL